ncbi:hypothetical protein [Paracoccus sp. IB05]|uniref:hypothetical protein n=1 Tax=Paracoccus sp. IB05 TaxID=2779367 RepID=UPI0018E8AE11|nr:hypothetical protein [Paracoccus sp. IB05]MBJ2152110.1 hypothetical protein [Paracoccus sp. IB05]
MFHLSHPMRVLLLPLVLAACVSPEPQRGNSYFDRPIGSSAAPPPGIAFTASGPAAGALATGGRQALPVYQVTKSIPRDNVRGQSPDERRFLAVETMANQPGATLQAAAGPFVAKRVILNNEADFLIVTGLGKNKPKDAVAAVEATGACDINSAGRNVLMKKIGFWGDGFIIPCQPARNEAKRQERIWREAGVTLPMRGGTAY